MLLNSCQYWAQCFSLGQFLHHDNNNKKKEEKERKCKVYKERALILSNIGCNVFLLANFRTTATKTTRKKRCDVYKRALKFTNIGHNIFLLANFCTTTTQNKEEK
jgi:hypothetical protein